jgi:hypothetical protein
MARDLELVAPKPAETDWAGRPVLHLVHEWMCPSPLDPARQRAFAAGLQISCRPDHVHQGQKQDQLEGRESVAVQWETSGSTVAPMAVRQTLGTKCVLKAWARLS